MPHSLPGDASLVYVRKQAKQLKRQYRDRELGVCDLLRLLPRFVGASNDAVLDAGVSLQEIHHALALGYGFASWSALRRHIDGQRTQAGDRIPDIWRRAIFTGKNDDVQLTSGVNRQRRSYRDTKSGLTVFDDGFLLSHPSERPGEDERAVDLYPGLAELLGDQDFEISITLDARSAPMTLREGTSLQKFGVLLKLEMGAGTYNGGNIFFGFDCGLDGGNRPFCQFNWSYFVDEFDATGTDETVTLRRVGDTFSISDASNGSKFAMVAGPLTDHAVHADMNDAHSLISGMTVTGVTLCTLSPGDAPFPVDAGRFRQLSIESVALDRDVNIPPGGDGSSVIQGRVAAGGFAVAGAAVTLVRGGTETTHFADEDGHYRHRVGAGAYTVKAKAPGTFERLQVAEVADGKMLDIDFDLDRKAVELYVDIRAALGGDGTRARPFTTIQAALNLCSKGSVVRIAAGTYPDPVELIPDVAIIGAGADETFVTSDGFWGMAARPFIQHHYISWDAMLGKAVLPNVRLSAFTLDPKDVDERDFPTYDADEFTPVLQAVMAIDADDADTLARLLEETPGLANARIHAPDAWHEGTTLLVRAAFAARSDNSSEDGVRIAELLIDHGADLEAIGGQYLSHGYQPVAAAAWRNNIAFARPLLAAGADVNARNTLAINCALSQGRTEVIPFLLENGAKPTPHQMVRLGRIGELYGAIDSDPTILTMVDGAGRTILDIAVEMGLVDDVTRLIARGADPRRRDLSGIDALERAELRSQTGVIRALLEAGVEPSLMTAVVLDDIELGRRIVAADPGAIHRRFAQGWTPTDVAHVRGFEKIERWLRSLDTSYRRHYPAIMEQLAEDHTVRPLMARTPLPNTKIGFVQVPYRPSLNVTEAITVMAWVYPLQASQEGVILARSVQWPAPSAFVMRSLSDTFELHWTDHTTTALGHFVPPFFEWSHLCGTYDGDTMRVFLNGDAVDTRRVGRKTINSTRHPLQIGNAKGMMACCALIDGVMLWNRALPQSEIERQMAAPTDAPGLVGWWPLDVASGLVDRSANHNHGKLMGAGALWTEDLPHAANHQPNQVLWVEPDA